MVFQEREELYLALSRKELQELCRTHGLPSSNSTKGRLAKLLVGHFNRRGAALEADARRKRGRPRLRCLAGEKMKEIYRGGDPQMSGKKESDVCKEKQDCVKAVAPADGAVCSQRCQRGKDDLDHCGTCQDCFAIGNVFGSSLLVRRGNGNSNEISSGSGLASSSEIFLDAPATFQFFVRAEEGISLYVDLHSSPSNWVKRLNDEVSINQKAHEKSWSICHELRDTGMKDVDMSLEENIRVSKNCGGPPTTRSDENKESSKSSLTSIVQDKCAETMEFLNERNQLSSSYAISSGVEYCNHSIDPNCSVLALPCPKVSGKDFVQSDNSLSSGHSLNRIISKNTHTGNGEIVTEANLALNVNSLNCRNAESDSTDKSPISMSETSNIVPKMCHDGAVQNSEDIQMYQGSDSRSAILQESGPGESMHPSQQCPEKVISESHADIVNLDAGDPIDDLPQELTCGSLGSSISENVTPVPSEEQCNNSCVKEKVSSGDNKLNNLMGKSCKRNSKSDISENKRRCTSVEVSERSTINLRSRKTLARGPVYGAAFPRRSMRLISK